MRRRSQAPSAVSAARKGTTRAHKTLFGLVCLCVLGLAAFIGSGAPSAGADEAAPGRGTLPDSRAWELVSGGDKLGNEVVGISSQSHAASGESPLLPAAFSFASLGGFADVRGTGLGTEYVSQRRGSPGTSGWSVHAITPPQEPVPLVASFAGFRSGYVGEMSSDLTAGTYRSWSPVTDAPNVAHVPNLYARRDLRDPGAGSYQLLTGAVSLLAPPPFDGSSPQPAVADASEDFRHVLFESQSALTSDASGSTIKLYKSDDGVVRLVSAGPACSGDPCSQAGVGATGSRYTERTLSRDGRRVNFTVIDKLFQLDDRGTLDVGDDATVQVNASEASAPEPTSPATFATASADGSRVFFTSGERLTDADGGGLYMWERQPTNEQQSVTVDATGGTFTLTAHEWPSHGTGTLTNGSTDVTGVSGSFTVGQTITAPGIPAGTTIVGRPDSSMLTLSAPATADGEESLSASVDGTTPPLAHDASAAEVQSALEALPQIGAGNVQVTGGPGDAGGSSPYVVTFVGALAGINVAELTADGGSLTGGAASASVTTTAPVRNLRLLVGGVSATVFGASEDGHRLYFGAGGGQLVNRGPILPESGIYSWQDAEGAPGGTLSFVAGVIGPDLGANGAAASYAGGLPRVSRVSPDGRHLLFEASDGSHVGLGYDHGACSGNPVNGGLVGCAEIYVYSADGSTPAAPDLVCASCNPRATATANALVNVRAGASGLATTSHLSHALSDDGRFVFFSTAEALVPEDVNGASDAYEFDTVTKTPHLISSGKDPSGSFFLDASANGHDVYFVTRERLVGWDRDGGYDAYDARIGGGFPEPVTTSECVGEGCQGGAQPGPAAPTITSGINGRGNQHAHRHARCAKNKRKVRHNGKVRCVRKRHVKHNRRAGR